jgi:hypothetical protein
MMQTHSIEWDHAKATSFGPSDLVARRLKRVLTGAIRITWTPLHILHPYELKYMCGWGHPLAPMKREEWIKANMERPLWLHFTDLQGGPSCLRRVPMKRLKRAILAKLLERDFAADGKAVDGNEQIWGTMHITILSSARLLKLNMDELGDLIASGLTEKRSPKS